MQLLLSPFKFVILSIQQIIEILDSMIPHFIVLYDFWSWSIGLTELPLNRQQTSRYFTTPLIAHVTTLWVCFMIPVQHKKAKPPNFKNKNCKEQDSDLPSWMTKWGRIPYQCGFCQSQTSIMEKSMTHVLKQSNKTRVCEPRSSRA